eukprot:3526841-Amphidinium_carterae.2
MPPSSHEQSHTTPKAMIREYFMRCSSIEANPTPLACYSVTANPELTPGVVTKGQDNGISPIRIHMLAVSSLVE